MKPETIKAIFTNFLFVIGVILMIVGFVQATLTVTRIATFDKYPLASWDEGRCENNYVPTPAAIDTKPMMIPSVENASDLKQKCLDSVEMQRKVQKTEDIVKSVSFLVSGGVLVYFFRRFILR